MKCIYCGHPESKVIDSRSGEDGTAIRRRRECLKCAKRFTTYEKVESVPLIVIKKDGSRQPFRREKIINGLVRACEKRPVSLKQIEDLTNEIESKFYNSFAREIPSEKIGELVMEKLKSLDEVAYVRFASVYRQFKDVNTFIKEIEKLINDSKK